MVTTQIKERCWRFLCPECGIGDEEIGERANAEEFYCEVCLSEDGRHVRLRRWIVDETPTTN